MIFQYYKISKGSIISTITAREIFKKIVAIQLLWPSLTYLVGVLAQWIWSEIPHIHIETDGKFVTIMCICF